MSNHPKPGELSLLKPSFSLKNRLLRSLWGLVYVLAFRWTPRPMHRWRAWVLRCFGAQLGRNTRIYPSVQVWAPWNLTCADEVCLGPGVNIYNQSAVEIGTRAIISQGTQLCTGTHDYTSPLFPLITFPILIEPDAWLAAEVFVHPGVTIGTGAVIGARSLVTKDMPAWTVCAGHPCRPLKPRTMET